MDQNARVKILVDGAEIGTRRTINFVTGGGGGGGGATFPDVATAAVVLVGSQGGLSGPGNSLTYTDSWRPDDTGFATLGSPPSAIGLLYDTTGGDPSFTTLLDGVWQFQVRIRWTDDLSATPPDSMEIVFDNELSPSLVSSIAMSFPGGSGAIVGVAAGQAVVELVTGQFFSLTVNIVTSGNTYSLDYWVQITRLA